MLAKVPVHRLSPDVIAAPPSFTATLNLSPDPPASNQFSFAADGTSVDNLVWVDTPTMELSITLAEGALFSDPPIYWSLVPDDASPPNPSVIGDTLRFTVEMPTHFLFPYAFRLSVDVPGITGIRSQNIYLAKPLAGGTLPLFLKYGSDGNFSLVDSPDSSQDGKILGAQLVMVNVLPELAITVTLLVEPDPPASAGFVSENPILWSSGPPPWLLMSPPPTSELLNLKFDPSSMGQSTSFQFFVEVETNGGQTALILSPDPILINATIGDGG
jgi:hypothetical protein